MMMMMVVVVVMVVMMMVLYVSHDVGLCSGLCSAELDQCLAMSCLDKMCLLVLVCAVVCAALS